MGSIIWLLLPSVPLVASSFIPHQRPLSIPSSTHHIIRAGLPVANSTKSFWLDTPGANPLADLGSSGPLTSDADVCIIGSGITGVSAAYHLSRKVMKPLKTVILEARKFCSGATGRNGGHLTPFGSRGFADNSAQYGDEEAYRNLAIEDYTTAQIAQIIRKHGLAEKTSFVHGGHIRLFLTPEEEIEAALDHLAAQFAGADVSEEVFVNKGNMTEKYGIPHPGAQAKGFNIWPSKFVTELFKIANSSDPDFQLALHTHTPVTSFSSSSDASRRWSLDTPRGSVQCSHVIHATNAYASHLLPQYAGPAGIIPTRGQVIAFRANASVEELTPASWDTEDAYWHPVAFDTTDEKLNPLIILGGERSIAGEGHVDDDSELNPAIGKALRDYLPPLFPGKYVKQQEPEMEWSGIMGYTAAGVPFVGPVPPLEDNRTLRGHYISAGYTGHGMPRTFACAEVVADMVKADIYEEDWEAPPWLPTKFLTWTRQ